MKSRNSGPLRTVDVARRTSYSVQQIRNLEQTGVLPSATRTTTGYRTYDERHVQAALAYRALATGTGPVEAKRILRAANKPPEVLALLDEAHAKLHTERQELALAKAAAEAIAAEPITEARPSDAMTISELATALGVRPSTLRHWETEGLLTPDRDAAQQRRYTPTQVRDARIIHQLRMAGYRITPLRTLMPQLRHTTSKDELMAMLATRTANIDTRSRALLEGTTALNKLIP